MIVLQPVLEIVLPDDFDLWPVAEVEPYGFLALDGSMTPEQVGAAVARIADHKRAEPEEPDRPDGKAEDPFDALLCGPAHCEQPYAPGGFRVADPSTGAVLVPGCCNGVEEWRDWLDMLDGHGPRGFGHDPSPSPSPSAELLGDTARLTVANEREDSPVIELPATELRRLVAGAERDLVDFLDLAGRWAAVTLPARHVAPVTAALARALDPGPDLALAPAPAPA
ncbi:hypothetical protein ACWEQL_13445 [Kitasatospora sp. NPDC004240]